MSQSASELDLRSRFQPDAAVKQARETLLEHVEDPEQEQAIREITEEVVEAVNQNGDVNGVSS